jgi:hypothetical protein
MVQARAGEQPDEREQNKITQADSHDTWASTCERKPSAHKVLCWWPDALRPPAWMRLRKLLNVLHPVESSPQPRVSRFSHMVDVHTPVFFALGLA